MADKASGVIIRPMTRSELDLAVDWAAGEGWNPGLSDAEVFYSVDPGGFLAAEYQGRMVGSISAVSYSGRFGFIGFYIVRPEYRGRGFGLKLWQEAVKRLDGMIIGLDGVVAQQENYRRSGFDLAFNNARYEGTGGGDPPGGTVDLRTLDMEQILGYDASCFPAPRPEFIRGWINMPGAAAEGVVDEGRIKGFGVLRPCRNGFKIGPLFADDDQTADLIFKSLCARAPGRPVFLDVPGSNLNSLEMARKRGLKEVFQTARMYKNGRPKWPAARIYGVTTFELG